MSPSATPTTLPASPRHHKVPLFVLYILASLFVSIRVCRIAPPGLAAHAWKPSLHLPQDRPPLVSFRVRRAVNATCKHHACLRLRVHEQAEILLQSTCEQVVIAWGQQTGSFLYQNNHKVTILFLCIQSSETVCPKSCTEYSTDVIPPSS